MFLPTNDTTHPVRSAYFYSANLIFLFILLEVVAGGLYLTLAGGEDRASFSLRETVPMAILLCMQGGLGWWLTKCGMDRNA